MRSIVFENEAGMESINILYTQVRFTLTLH